MGGHIRAFRVQQKAIPPPPNTNPAKHPQKRSRPGVLCPFTPVDGQTLLLSERKEGSETRLPPLSVLPRIPNDSPSSQVPEAFPLLFKARRSFHSRDKSPRGPHEAALRRQRPPTCQRELRQRHPPRQEHPVPHRGGRHLGLYQSGRRPEEGGGCRRRKGRGRRHADAPPPPRLPPLVWPQDGMAVALRPPTRAALRGLRSLVFAGVAGSGSTRCRCPLGGIRGPAP